jgi:hypothetical protein
VSNIHAFCFFDLSDMLSFEAKWKAIESRFGFWGAVQSVGQVRRQAYVPGLAVKLKINFDHIAFGNAGGGAICSAYTNQTLTSHQRHSAAPRMAVNSDGDRRSGFGTQGLHDYCRDFDTSGISGRNYRSSKLQFTISRI